MTKTVIAQTMVPLDEYATVSQDATIMEAVSALERAQARFDETRYRHRAVLALDDEGKVVGKLSQMDVIKALDPDHIEKLDESSLARFGISSEYLQRVLGSHEIHGMSMLQLCEGAARLIVADVMHTPTEGEFIEIDATPQEAVRRFVTVGQHSLLVTKNGDIVGILRLTDVFATTCRAMRNVSPD